MKTPEKIGPACTIIARGNGNFDYWIDERDNYVHSVAKHGTDATTAGFGSLGFFTRSYNKKPAFRQTIAYRLPIN